MLRWRDEASRWSNIRGAGRGGQESLDHVPIPEFELLGDKGWLREASDYHGSPKGGAREHRGHDNLFIFARIRRIWFTFMYKSERGKCHDNLLRWSIAVGA